MRESTNFIYRDRSMGFALRCDHMGASLPDRLETATPRWAEGRH
ncbi:hypothetical protein CJF30_00004355 [Rutstroemia sp. NJR-2017a BBW]|nr:hypothetical protein CJF30_00004355 [Rutstroemia sp. NJR-2017a BBW]